MTLIIIFINASNLPHCAILIDQFPKIYIIFRSQHNSGSIELESSLYIVFRKKFG